MHHPVKSNKNIIKVMDNFLKNESRKRNETRKEREGKRDSVSFTGPLKIGAQG